MPWPQQHTGEGGNERYARSVLLVVAFSQEDLSGNTEKTEERGDSHDCRTMSRATGLCYAVYSRPDPFAAHQNERAL